MTFDKYELCLYFYLCVSVFGISVSLYLVSVYPCIWVSVYEEEEEGGCQEQITQDIRISTTLPSPCIQLTTLYYYYFFFLLLFNDFFEYLLRLTAWDVKDYLHNETSFCSYSYAHVSAPPQKVFRKTFLYLGVLLSLTLCGKQVLLRHFFTFM